MPQDLVNEPLNPAQSESVVKKCTNNVSLCTVEFRRTGDRLMYAERAHRRAEITAYYDPDCPAVSRTEGVTVRDREMFVERRTVDERDALRAAQLNRETALEALRSARNELQGAMAINASVREAYRVVATLP